MSVAPAQVEALLPDLEPKIAIEGPSRRNQIVGAVLVLWTLTGVYTVRTDQSTGGSHSLRCGRGSQSDAGYPCRDAVAH